MKIKMKINQHSPYTLQVKSGLRRGSVNPFKIIGIESISVVNSVQNCSQDLIDCTKQTDLQVTHTVEWTEVTEDSNSRRGGRRRSLR